MKHLLGFLSFILLNFSFGVSGDDFRVTAFSPNGDMTLTNAFTNGVVTIEQAATVEGPWTPEKNLFSTQPTVRCRLEMGTSNAFFRPLALVLSGPGGFTNLAQSYGTLTTVAGSGATQCTSCNNWQPEFEGGWATNAVLSSPHIAMADHAGNIYIADKRAHAIRKVRIDGTIVTVAGINVAGSGPTNPSPATSVALNNPNGLWVREDGLFYILDRDNGYIRRVDTNGLMTTIVDHGFAIPGGRGLWVSEDESRIFYAAGTQVMTWDPTNGLAPFASGFSDLGNIAMDPQGHLAVTDDRLCQVFRLQSDGTRTVIAGNGNIEGGQDGDLAINVGWAAVRGIWFLPTGAFFLCTDVGCQVWYVDTSGYIHLFLNGDSNAHAGDGAWFYEDPSLPKIGAGKQIVLDDEGNLLVTENAVGYVRKITFLHHGQ
jgi:hypothetical protein